ncbi:MAG: lytic enzyme [Gallionellaceae bacterium]|nr:MAG: lytic enzyme [Gallionellaceae bacterium]
MPITQKQLGAIMPLCKADQWTDPLNAAMERFEINTPTRVAAFLAQLAHESTETTRRCGRSGFRHRLPPRLT